jgi:hypothetical protein
MSAVDLPFPKLPVNVATSPHSTPASASRISGISRSTRYTRRQAVVHWHLSRAINQLGNGTSDGIEILDEAGNWLDAEDFVDKLMPFLKGLT